MPQHSPEIVDEYQYAMERAALYASWADFEGDQDEAKKHRLHLAWLEKQLRSKTPQFPLKLYELDARADDFGELIDYHHFGYGAPPNKRGGIGAYGKSGRRRWNSMMPHSRRAVPLSL